MIVVVGCASTRIIEHRPYEGGKVARPDRIIVHALAATHADIPAGSALADEAARYFVSVGTGGTVELGFGSGTAEQHTAIEGYLMTVRGLRRLGSGALDSGDGKTPSVALPLEVVVASDPIGLIGGAVEVGGEASASTTIEQSGKRTAKAIAERLRVQFQKRGWVQSEAIAMKPQKQQ